MALPSKKDTLKSKPDKSTSFLLNDQNAIPFFFDYQKKHLENRVRISTRFGDIDIELYQNTPYHRANFIYLTKKGYFNGLFFLNNIQTCIDVADNDISTFKKGIYTPNSIKTRIIIGGIGVKISCFRHDF